MIWTRTTAYDLYIVRLAYLPNQLPTPGRYFTRQYPMPVLRTKYHMVFQIVQIMRAVSIIHSPLYTKVFA